MKKHRQVIIPAVVMFVYAAAVSRLPLLNALGYEYCAAIAFALPVVPGLFLLKAYARLGAADGLALRQAAACLFAALVVGWLNSFLVKNCAPGEGLGWFLLITVAGMAWVAALAAFCAAAFRRAMLWYFVILAAVLLHPVFLGYYTPRVDSYNFLYGYFPGFTYDEDLAITKTLGLWRLVTLICAAGLAAATGIARGRRERAGQQLSLFEEPRMGSPILPAAIVLCLAVIVLGWFLRTDAGVETTASSLSKALGSAVATQHFRIHYDASKIPEREIRWVAAEHEFRFAQMSAFLETDTNRVIDSYLYPDAEAKRRLIGAGNTDIAKPWRSEIHLDGESWRATLGHELAHALAGEFGMPVIRANVNVGLTEGLATAASSSFGNFSLREYAAAMLRFGIVADPASLLRPTGFAFNVSTVSYVLMGAFCEHLIERYGMHPFRAWYGGAAPEDAYGKDAQALVAEWRASLDSVKVPDERRAHVEYYFRRSSIFAKECARAVANLNAEGSRALEGRRYQDAMEAFTAGLNASWNAGSFAGLARTFLGAGDPGRAVRMFNAELADTARRGTLAGLQFVYGDALLLRNDERSAREVYRGIRALDLSPAANEAAELRLAVCESPEYRELLAPWVAGMIGDSVAFDRISRIASTVPPSPLLQYVMGRLYLSREDYASAARATVEYLKPFSYDALNGAMGDIAATAFFRLGDFEAARVFYERTLDFNPGPGVLRRMRDRAERCRWFEVNWSSVQPVPQVP